MAAQLTLDERGVGARAFAVERAGHQFLARAAFALDQHGGLGAGDFADELPQTRPCAALWPSRSWPASSFPGSGNWLTLSSWVNSSRLAQRDFDLLVGERLDEVIKRAVLHALDGRFDASRTRCS